MKRALTLLGLALLATPARAHSFQPAVIELHLGPGRAHELILRSPRLPPGDDRVFEPRVAAPCTLAHDEGPRWRVACDAAEAAVAALTLVQVAGAAGVSAPEVLVDRRWPDGRRELGAAGGGSAVAPPAVLAYARLGVAHILGGFDHLLFVAGLVALGGTLGALAGTVTAFTAGHSVTLAAIALGVFRPDSAPIEVLIAVTLLLLGRELLRGGTARTGPRLAFVFGLAHGGGFAGALADIGLPPSGALAALFLFNLGIELGQLLVVAALLGLLALPPVRRLPMRTLCGYALGITAAVLLLERLPLLGS